MQVRYTDFTNYEIALTLLFGALALFYIWRVIFKERRFAGVDIVGIAATLFVSVVWECYLVAIPHPGCDHIYPVAISALILALISLAILWACVRQLYAMFLTAFCT